MNKSLEEGLRIRRREIDALDNAFLALLVERVRIAQEIGSVKHELGQPLRDPIREQEHLHAVQAAAARLSLHNPDQVGGIIKAVMAYCLREEQEGEPIHQGQLPGF